MEIKIFACLILFYLANKDLCSGMNSFHKTETCILIILILNCSQSGEMQSKFDKGDLEKGTGGFTKF